MILSYEDFDIKDKVKNRFLVLDGVHESVCLFF